MARVVLLSLLFPPDNVSTAHLMADVCEDLVAAGHDVTVITTTPHYNRDAAAEAVQPLTRHWGRLVQTSRYRGMRVYHTLMPRKGPSSVGRVLAWALFHALSVTVGVMSVGRVDVLVTPSPPLTMGIAAWLLSRVKRAPYIYSVLELHPDIAISLGLVRRPVLIRFLFALERFVYARAARLTVIAEAMRRRVIAKGVPAAKVTLIPNFVDTTVALAVPRPNPFSRAHGLDDCFVVSYAGNVGPAQGLEALIDAAAALRDLPRVRIVVVGGGILWQTLADRIAAAGLDNVVLLPHQPFDAVPDIYGASDLCVVAQSATTTSDAVPSKVYRIMGAGKPVLAMTVPGSDLATLVGDAGGGVVVSAADPAAIARAIREAAATPEACRAMGEAGRAHVEAHYSRRALTARYNALVNELTAESR
jgi:colanic acid biosynthesis glycosyl transferase WcaI